MQGQNGMQIIGGNNEYRKLTNGSKNSRQNENKVTHGQSGVSKQKQGTITIQYRLTQKCPDGATVSILSDINPIYSTLESVYWLSDKFSIERINKEKFIKFSKMIFLQLVIIDILRSFFLLSLVLNEINK